MARNLLFDGCRECKCQAITNPRSKHWGRCIEDARERDVLLFVSGEDEQACGALIQAGAALATRRQVFVVSPEAWTFSHHPTCRNCSTVAEAISATVAMQAGEVAYGYSVGSFRTSP